MSKCLLYMMEMIVSNLEILKFPSNADPSMETCVHLRILNEIGMELCEGSLGLIRETTGNKRSGKQCLFTVGNELSEDSKVVISVFKKTDSNLKILVGAYEMVVRDISKQNTIELTADSKAASVGMTEKDSIKSLKSFRLNPGATTENLKHPRAVKKLFPLYNNEKEVTGFIELILRISCLGSMLTQSLIFTADSNSTETLSNESVPNGESFHSLLNKESIDVVSPARPPTPLSSGKIKPKDDCNEYVAKINGNTLIIRIAKGVHMTCQMLEPGADDSPNFLKNVIKCSKQDSEIHIKVPPYPVDGRMPEVNSYYSRLNPVTCPCSVSCPVKKRKKCPCHKLPVIRGTLKYPSVAHPYAFNIELNSPQTNSLVKCQEPYQNGLRNQLCNKGTDELRSRSPTGVQVWKKSSCDPNTDVFVLKLTEKKSKRGTEDIELELRTPKCPDLTPRSKNTVAAQTIEDEFYDFEETEKKVEPKNQTNNEEKSPVVKSLGKGKKRQKNEKSNKKLKRK